MSMPLALVTPAVYAGQGQMVVLQELPKHACIVGCFLGRLVRTDAIITHLSVRKLNVSVAKEKNGHDVVRASLMLPLETPRMHRLLPPHLLGA